MAMPDPSRHERDRRAVASVDDRLDVQEPVSIKAGNAGEPLRVMPCCGIRDASRSGTRDRHGR
ncbi:hypothetical protein BGLA2_2200010 [Burkholderia gladioli]|nr:hypothetical protein BGLA2_2200010 [Burkholderia gladioli]